MGIFDGVLLCTDIDGTLIRKIGSNSLQKVVSEKNINAINYFKSQGGLFTFATGRYSDFYLERDFGVEPNTYIISLNGTVIGDTFGKEVLHTSIMDEGVVKEICSFANDILNLNYLLVHSSELKIQHYNECKDFSKTNKIVMCTHSVEEALKLKEALVKNFSEKVIISRSWDTGVEALNLNSTKGDALVKLKEITNSKITVSCGDYENDIELIKMADYGFAVANALDEVKSFARFVTKNDNEHDAVSEVIYTLEQILTNK